MNAFTDTPRAKPPSGNSSRPRVEVANAADLNVIVEGLQMYWAKVWQASHALKTRSPSNAAMMARKANNIARLLDKMRVGWKQPAELPIEFVKANEQARFWVKAEDIGKTLAGLVIEAGMVDVFDPETGEVTEAVPDVYQWHSAADFIRS